MPHTQYSPSCTIRSMTNTTSLKLRDYQIDTTAEGNRLFSFTLFNPGPGDAYRLYRIPFLDGGGTWHECKDGPLGSVPIGGPVKIPWQLERCQYIIDSQHKKISVAVQWFCDDRDPINAYAFPLYQNKASCADDKTESSSERQQQRSCLLKFAQKANPPPRQKASPWSMGGCEQRLPVCRVIQRPVV